MADKTIATLDNELVTVGANDLIGVWDVAAGQYKRAKRSNVVGATITGGGTIATGGFTLTVAASGTAALMNGGTWNVTVLERKSQTVNANWANYIEMTPAVASYNSQTFLLALTSWDATLNNPFDSQLWLVGGTGGVYTATKLGGGTNLAVTINSGKIRVSNAHATTNAVVVADLIQIK